MPQPSWGGQAARPWRRTARGSAACRLPWLGLVLTAAIAGQQDGGQAPLAQPGRSGADCDSAHVERLVSRARAAVTGAAGARSLLRQARQACPGRVDLLLEEARLHADRGEHQQAVRAAEEYLSKVPDSVLGQEVKAQSELMAQRFELALETARELLLVAPKNAAALKVEGNALYLLGEASQAEAAFLRLLDLYPADSAGAYMLGRIYYQENRFELAAAQFQKVVALDPSSYKAHDNLALCFEALGDAGKAVRHYLAAIELVRAERPNYDWPYANLASLLIDENDPSRGFDAAATAAKLNPASARNFFLAGKALVRLGRNREALQWLERAVDLDPHYAPPLYVLGQVYRRLGDSERASRALAAFEAAKAAEPDEIR